MADAVNPPASLLLLGATGLVGGECLRLVARDPSFGRVVVPLRRNIQAADAPHVEYHRIDFDEPATYEALLDVDVVICALGTTIRKAGTREAFRKVDYEYPLTFARLARANGARHYLLISSAGADPTSKIFYSRVKGELETALAALGFPAVTIFRPSLLLGNRAEFRFGEAVGQKLLGPFSSLFPKGVRPVPAARVADAVVRAAQPSDARGLRIVGNAEMV